jgi:hypothetical protein
MKKIFIRFCLFVLIGLVIGELTARVLHLSPDVPKRFVDSTGIQRFIPHQSGYYSGINAHSWKVNEYGWVGCFDLSSKKPLVAIIGDSYIENFMNPQSCHQCELLSGMANTYNFIEAGRAGITFIESMEISHYLDTLNPVGQLIYVNERDFAESISNSFVYHDRMQIDVLTGKICHAQLKSPGLKKILYNWKFLYYMYNRFPLFVENQNKNEGNKNTDNPIDNMEYTEMLFKYCKNNYNLENKTIVFHPESRPEIIELAQKYGFKIIKLSYGSEASNLWHPKADTHWNCYGHKQVAIQVASNLDRVIN